MKIIHWNAGYSSEIEKVDENLARINDIILELEKQLGPLKHQAENAKVFLNLSNRLKKINGS